MQTRRSTLLLLGAVLSACGSGPTHVSLEVVFPDAESRAATARLELTAMRPGAAATCAALLEGSASPGAPGYELLDQLSVLLPSLEGARPLEVPAAGPVLFFALGLTATGEPLVHGCLATHAGEGAATVSLQLERLAPPCTQDSECQSAAWCDGDETCVEGRCQAGGARTCQDGDACTQDVCNEDLDRCENPPLAEPPGAEGPLGDPTCGDGLDNDCDGLTDDLDPACIACTGAGDCDDGNACTADTCDAGACANTAVDDGTPCDDGLYCTISDGCAAGRCGGADRDCGGVADGCNTGVCDELADACTPVPVADGTGCEDGLWCTAEDTCQAGACQGGASSPCLGECEAGCDEAADACLLAVPGAPCTQDGTFCNGLEVCDALGACTSPGDPCGSSECGTCDEGADTCEVNQGSPCSGDGFDCTSSHACDAAGECVGAVRDDAYCAALDPGSRCLPGCSADASGCAQAPGSLLLDCPGPISLATSDRSTCGLTLAGPGAAGQAGCLACRAELGEVLLELTGFDDGAGGCALDGWSLVAGGGTCNRTMPGDCSRGTENRTCCSTLASLCDTATFGRPVLRSDNASNCGGTSRQWRLTRTFDLRGLHAARVCFTSADVGASASSGLSVHAADPTHALVTLACLLAGPQPGVDGVLTPQCVDLPAWTDDNPAVSLVFRAHSEDVGEQVFLGGVSLRAWSAGCTPVPGTVLDEPFDTCDLSAWSVLSGEAACLSTGCSNQPAWLPGLGSNGPAVSVETRVDTSALQGSPELCFQMGSSGATPGDGLAVWADAGAGFLPIYQQDAPLGLDGQCREICLGLGDALPGAARNPNLGLRFDLVGDGSVGLYGVRLSGSPGCPADGEVSLSTPADQGGGQYAFEAVDAAGSPLGIEVTCTWNQDPDLSARDGIWFQP